MPDTTRTFSPYRRPLIRFFGASMMFLAALLLATSVGSTQDSDDFDCGDFSTQAEAQRVYDSNSPSQDPFNLDADDDGEACESLDSEGSSITPSPTEDDDQSASGNQYGDDDPQPVESVQTPQTGGPDLILLSAGLLFLLGATGLGLSYRRQ